MADNKQNQNQKQNEGGMPNQRNEGNRQNMPGGSDRMDTAGDATRGEQGGTSREFQGTGNKAEGSFDQDRKGNDMQNERRPSGSEEGQKGFEDRDREKKPA